MTMFEIIAADCRAALSRRAPFDLLIADPPYGVTSLAWDRHCDGWIEAAAGLLKPTGSMWVFGSMRMFQSCGSDFSAAGWRYAQDIVWEKHKGSSLRDDRFKRVHEHVCQFYLKGTKWADVYNDVQTTYDATFRRPKKWVDLYSVIQTTPDGIRSRKRPPHFGHGTASVLSL